MHAFAVVSFVELGFLVLQTLQTSELVLCPLLCRQAFRDKQAVFAVLVMFVAVLGQRL